MRVRALWAFLALLLIGTVVFVPLAGTVSAKAKNPFKSISVTGAGDGATFSGKLTITSFQADGNVLYAVGSLKGDVTRSDGTKSDVKTTVRWPVESINGTSLSPVAATTTGKFAAMQLGCEILDLQLGPLDLTLLGLHIFLDEVNLEITAIPGGGLLGDLLCAVNNLLNPLAPLAQIAAALNAIINFFNNL